MAFRYRILFYHENQPWLPKVSAQLELPMFHLFLTDSDTVVQKQLESNEVDIILTGMNTKHFKLVEDEGNSMSFKQALLWDVIEGERHSYQILVLCAQREIDVAAQLVQAGKITDYCIVSPMLDKSRLFLSIMKALEQGLCRQLIEERLNNGDKLPKELFESVEVLQALRDTPPPEPEPIPVAKPDSWGDIPLSGFSEEMQGEADQPFWSIEGVSPPETEPEAEPEPSAAFSAFPSVFSPNPPADIPFESSFGADSVFASLKDNLTEVSEGPKGRSRPEPEPVEPWGSNLPKRDRSASDVGGITSVWAKMKKSDFEILLVDNDRDSIELVNAVVATVGFKVLVANSAEEAMFYLGREIFELLLVKRELPDKDGLDLINTIRVKGPQSHIPSIVLSNLADEDHVIKSIKVGANYILVKPFNPAKLMEHIQEFIGGRV